MNHGRQAYQQEFVFPHAGHRIKSVRVKRKVHSLLKLTSDEIAMKQLGGELIDSADSVYHACGELIWADGQLIEVRLEREIDSEWIE